MNHRRRTTNRSQRKRKLRPSITQALRFNRRSTFTPRRRTLSTASQTRLRTSTINRHSRTTNISISHLTKTRLTLSRNTTNIRRSSTITLSLLRSRTLTTRRTNRSLTLRMSTSQHTTHNTRRKVLLTSSLLTMIHRHRQSSHTKRKHHRHNFHPTKTHISRRHHRRTFTTRRTLTNKRGLISRTTTLPQIQTITRSHLRLRNNILMRRHTHLKSSNFTQVRFSLSRLRILTVSPMISRINHTTSKQQKHNQRRHKLHNQRFNHIHSQSPFNGTNTPTRAIKSHTHLNTNNNRIRQPPLLTIRNRMPLKRTSLLNKSKAKHTATHQVQHTNRTDPD